MPMKVRYTVVDGEVIAEKRNGVRRQYVPDPLGSTVALLNQSGEITDTFSYWPHGEVAVRGGSTPTPFQFVGSLGYYTDSTSRVYVRSRTYSSTLGRWQMSDSAAYEEGLNLYNYANGSPASVVDPLGLGYVWYGCNDDNKSAIKKGVKKLCEHPNLDKFLDCVKGCPLGGLARHPEFGDEHVESAADCIRNWCRSLTGEQQNDPKVHLKFTCCRTYMWCWPKCFGKCAYAKHGRPPEIVICASAWDRRKCDDLHCIIAHELIHLCGPFDPGHKNDVWKCLLELDPDCARST